MDFFSPVLGLHISTAGTPNRTHLQRAGGAILAGILLRTLVCNVLLPEEEEDAAFAYVAAVRARCIVLMVSVVTKGAMLFPLTCFACHHARALSKSVFFAGAVGTHVLFCE